MAWIEQRVCIKCLDRNIKQIKRNKKATPNTRCKQCQGNGHYDEICSAPQGFNGEMRF